MKWSTTTANKIQNVHELQHAAVNESGLQNTIIIIIITHNTIFIVLSSATQSHRREFTLGLLSESRSAPGGCQLVGQAASLMFESAYSYMHIRMNINYILCAHQIDVHWIYKLERSKTLEAEKEKEKNDNISVNFN